MSLPRGNLKWSRKKLHLRIHHWIGHSHDWLLIKNLDTKKYCWQLDSENDESIVSLCGNVVYSLHAFQIISPFSWNMHANEDFLTEFYEALWPKRSDDKYISPFWKEILRTITYSQISSPLSQISGYTTRKNLENGESFSPKFDCASKLRSHSADLAYERRSSQDTTPNKSVSNPSTRLCQVRRIYLKDIEWKGSIHC